MEASSCSIRISNYWVSKKKKKTSNYCFYEYGTTVKYKYKQIEILEFTSLNVNKWIVVLPTLANQGQIDGSNLLDRQIRANVYSTIVWNN